VPSSSVTNFSLSEQGLLTAVCDLKLDASQNIKYALVLYQEINGIKQFVKMNPLTKKYIDIKAPEQIFQTITIPTGSGYSVKMLIWKEDFITPITPFAEFIKGETS